MPSEREIERLRQQAGVGGRRSVPRVDVPRGIVEFATDRRFLGLDLFPRQGTLLKLMTADLDSLTEFDLEVIEEWGSGFQLDDVGGGLAYRGERGTTPDVLDRMRWCRENGQPWFREIVLVLGRRASKSFLVSVLMAWRLWLLLATVDPQAHYQIPAGKSLLLQVFGTDQAAARRDAYGDLAGLVRAAPCFAPFLGAETSTTLSLLTPAQLAVGARPGIDDGLIVVAAAASTRTAGRGPTSPALWFDELAHVQGAGSTADSMDLYGAATPATGQFPDALIVQSSTPWETTGQLYVTYELALEVNPQTQMARTLDCLVVQLESPALYVDHERAGDIPMWPGGPPYPTGLEPKVTYAMIERQLAIDPVRARIEWYAQFGTVSNPYLTPDRVDGIFLPYKGRVPIQQTRGVLANHYVGHADPSKSNANFGFAVGHLEYVGSVPHVSFDVLHAWRPSDFSEGTINYLDVNEWLWCYVKDFMLRELTFDQYSSIQTAQDLQRRARVEGLSWQPRIYERTATSTLNYQQYELFKTVVNAGLIHAPHHDLAEGELKHLIEKNGKVVAPTSGPYRTKDVADAMVNVVWTLLRDKTDEIFAALGGLPPSGSQPGGLPVPGSPHYELSQFGKRQAWAARQAAIRRAGDPPRRW